MKPVIRTIVCLVLCTGLFGCVTGKPKLDADACVQGTWMSTNSVAVYRIAKVDGKMTVKGRSSYSGKDLIIRDVSWDGKVLRFTSYMPSTNLKVLHENRLLDADTMTSLATGKSTHTLIWKKEAEPK